MESKKKKILVADDEPAIRSLITLHLRRRGYEVVTAEDGVRACEAAQSEVPDLVLLDLMLPGRDGYSVLMNLRSNATTRNVPVVFLTGEAREEHEEISSALGANGFMQKPFSADQLAAVVETALRGKERVA